MKDLDIEIKEMRARINKRWQINMLLSFVLGVVFAVAWVAISVCLVGLK